MKDAMLQERLCADPDSYGLYLQDNAAKCSDTYNLGIEERFVSRVTGLQ